MRCPRCGLEVGSDGGKYNFRYGCPNCGWMHQVERKSADSVEDDEFDISVSQWVLCWFISIPFVLVFVVGPYLLAVLWSPPFARSSLFHVVYWSVWPLYLFASWLIPSDPPLRDQGYFGMLIPPPSHFGDNLKKKLFTALVLFLTPGKILVAAMLATPRYAAAECRLYAKNRRLRRQGCFGEKAAERNAARSGRSGSKPSVRVAGLSSPNHEAAQCGSGSREKHAGTRGF